MKVTMQTTRSFVRFCALSFFAFALFFFSSAPVDAKKPEAKVRDDSYTARYVSQTEKDPISIEAGSTKTVTITFRNNGTATWNNTGSRYISAYTMEPRYRDSEFKGPNWIGANQTGKMGGVIKPGENGKLAVTLTAPEKVGKYTEWFYLAAENYTWVKDGYFFLELNVIPKKEVPKVKVAATDNAPLAEQAAEEKKEIVYAANNIGQNVREVYVKGGEQIRLITLFQNIGDTAWEEYGILANTPVSTSDSRLSFADQSWHDTDLVLTKRKVVEPERSLREEFYFRAPAKEGDYTARFSLTANTVDVPDVSAEVVVHVTQDAPSDYKKATFYAAPEPEEAVRLDSEPRIRVGMMLPMEFVQFRSEEEDYRVIVGGEELGILPKTHLGVFIFDGTYHSFKGAEVDYEGPGYVRLEPVNNVHAIYSLSNYERYVKWKGPNNFNMYRGAFEYRKGKVDGKMYAVNDLLFEDYVAGIAETSNLANIDYIKALLVAARSYAYKAIGKYPFFDVLGNTYDQLYLGYESERLMQRVLQAQQETRGYMVTYDGEIVTTPYFANSTGMTKSWKQVWGGRKSYPWLVPVEAKYDRGQPMRGHGVGMSARDAAIRADKEGATWQELLKHYYTGVEVEKIYN